jgi:hypothetical protein
VKLSSSGTEERFLFNLVHITPFMKLAGLLSVALFSATLSYCQTWKRTGVENTGREIFYNAENITILDIGQHKNVIKVWFKEQFVNQNVSGVLYSSGYSLTLYAFDCNEKLWSINELIFCKPSGEIIQDYTYEFEWGKAPPGSPMALLSYFIRNKYSGNS